MRPCSSVLNEKMLARCLFRPHNEGMEQHRSRHSARPSHAAHGAASSHDARGYSRSNAESYRQRAARARLEERMANGAQEPEAESRRSSRVGHAQESAHSHARTRGARSRDAAETPRTVDARYSRRGNTRYADQVNPKHRRNRIIKRVAIALAALLTCVGAAAAIYIGVINGNLSAGLDSGLNNVLVQTNLTKEPFYMVLLGTDESIQRETDSTTDGTYRTDTIILVRIDPVNKKVTLISMPRDSYVSMGSYGEHKLNAAYAYGGAELAVSTISDLADVDISHFALVDMDGVVEIVDALGGIEVDVPMEIDDDMAGGHLDAGLQTLNGEQALILARSRHAYDEYGNGDEYRSANQRLVISAIAKKLLASDPATIASTVTALSECVQTDLSVSDIVGLAQVMRGLDASTDIYSATMPTTSAYVDGLWIEQVNTSEWKTMMSRVDQGLSPTESSEIDSATGIVLSSAGDGAAEEASAAAESKDGSIVVRNGSGYTGLGTEVANTLTSAGYTVSNTGNADNFDYKNTVVLYNDSSRASQAKAIAETIGHSASAQKNDGSYSISGDFLVIVGSTYVNTTS